MTFLHSTINNLPATHYSRSAQRILVAFFLPSPSRVSGHVTLLDEDSRASYGSPGTEISRRWSSRPSMYICGTMNIRENYVSSFPHILIPIVLLNSGCIIINPLAEEVVGVQNLPFGQVLECSSRGCCQRTAV